MDQTTGRPGRDPQKEHARICERVRKHLEDACGDPTLSLSYEAIGKACGISRGHFAKPEYAELVGEILDARVKRKGGGENNGGAVQAGGGDDSWTDADLEERMRFHAGAARDSMSIWLSRHRRSEDPSEAPLLLHDLDMAVAMLRQQADALRPLVAEHVRRADVAAVEQGLVHPHGPLFDRAE